jgi:hypothetical protein
MGIKEFFRKVKKTLTEEQQERNKDENEEEIKSGRGGLDEKRKISDLNEFEGLIDEEDSKLAEEKNRILDGIKHNVEIFVLDIREETGRLKNIDLDKRKEEQRLKNIVMENFNLYLGHLEKLSDELDLLVGHNGELDEYFNKIKSIFFRFDSSSGMNFEKATVLYGQDLKNAKNKISMFLAELEKIKKENSLIFEKDFCLRNIRGHIIELKSVISLQLSSRKEIKKIEDNITNFKEEISNLNGNYKAFKSSEEYKKEMEEKESIERERANIKKEIQELKQKIDFKSLTKKYHFDPKKHELVKNYSENFLESLKDDEHSVFFEIINEDYGNLSSDFKELKKKVFESKIEKKFKIEEKIKEITRELARVENQIADSGKEEDAENNKIERFEHRKKEIVSKIRDKLDKLIGDVELEI